MEPVHTVPAQSQELAISQANDDALPQLVGQIYAAAPGPERSRLLEFLMRPLGVLALVAVADGIFAKIRFSAGWPHLHVPLEDANRIQPDDIAQLVDRVQQVSTDAMDGLAAVVGSSPVIAGSTAAVILVAMLVQRQYMRRNADALAQSDPDLD
ncbi:MAG: hypothetical protein ABIR55_01120 [Burkholderiaceae bacterium]